MGAVRYPVFAKGSFRYESEAQNHIKVVVINLPVSVYPHTNNSSLWS